LTQIDLSPWSRNRSRKKQK